MPIRIEIELTSSAPDGSWTWRAAGAREPRGVLDGSILPPGSSVGDQLRVETEKDIDGIRVLSVVPGKEKSARSDVLELLPTEEQLRAGDPAAGAAQRPRRAARAGRGVTAPAATSAATAATASVPTVLTAASAARVTGPAGGGGERPAGDREHPAGDRRPGGEDRRRHRPHFTPPPEVPQRPKPKRLRPGKQHRTDVLEALPEEQRPVAELALQGIAAVRQRLREDNARLRAEGKPQMPEAAVMQMAEELIPRLRVADWLDRAEAAQRQLEHLDLRDLRSVVAASDDPVVARDESTRELAAGAQGGAGDQAGRGADAVARRRRGRPRRRPRRAGAAPVVGAAEGRRAVPGRPGRRGSARPRRRRCNPATAPTAGRPCSRRRRSRRCVRSSRRRRRRSSAATSSWRRCAGWRRCSPRSPRCSTSRSRPGAAVPKPLRPMTAPSRDKEGRRQTRPLPPPTTPAARGSWPEAAGSPAEVAGAEVARSPAEGDAEPPPRRSRPLPSRRRSRRRRSPRLLPLRHRSRPRLPAPTGDGAGEDASDRRPTARGCRLGCGCDVRRRSAEAAAVEAAESPVEDAVESPAAPVELLARRWRSRG